MTTMLMKALFEEVAGVTTDPVEMLRMMNDRLHRVLREGMFAAAAILSLRAEPPQVQYANAGLPYPFVIRPSEGRVEEVELADFPLGLFNGDVPLDFQARALPLLPGDVLLVGSDGIHAVAETRAIPSMLVGCPGFSRPCWDDAAARSSKDCWQRSASMTGNLCPTT